MEPTDRRRNSILAKAIQPRRVQVLPSHMSVFVCIHQIRIVDQAFSTCKEKKRQYGVAAHGLQLRMETLNPSYFSTTS
jgi:hypothetical protein